MYNLLIALGFAGIAFLIGALAGNPYYGLAPAMLIFPIAYFLLARRSGKQLEAVMMEVQKEMQAQRVGRATELLEGALPLGRWQFLVSKQIWAQLGAIEYIQQHFKKARPLLEKAWKRNWQAQAMLAAIDLRDKEHDAAIKRLGKAKFLGKRDPLMWAVLAYFHVRAGDDSAALGELAEARKHLEENEPLKLLQDAIANGRVKKFRWAERFGMGWYQFFPEQARRAGGPRSMRRQGPHFRGGKTYPHPRR